MFSSVFDSVLQFAMDGEELPARELWLAIERQFRSNKQSRAIYINHKFHSMTQGDSSIADYRQRMKSLATPFLTSVILSRTPNSQLVLNLLRGLNPRYTNTTNDIANEKGGFPSFAKARDMLTLKELHLSNETKVTTSTTLLAGAGSS
jgi:hypothetical protein